MDTARIREAADKIEKRQLVLAWISEFIPDGAELSGTLSIDVKINFASSRTGATEAQEILSSMARFSLRDIVQAAIQECNNTIVVYRDAIAEELEKEVTP